LAVSPNGQLVAGGGWQQIILWNEATRQFPVVYPMTLGMVNRLAFNPDGTILAGTVNTYYGNPHECWSPLFHVVELWDTQHNQRLTVLDGHYNMLTALAFSLDGKRLLTGYYDGAIESWGVNPGASVFG
jgi:WD40 repeat protein